METAGGCSKEISKPEGKTNKGQRRTKLKNKMKSRLRENEIKYGRQISEKNVRKPN